MKTLSDPPIFTVEERNRYSRQLVLRYIGEEGQRRLKQAKVAIAGVGGLGGHIAVSLAGLGVGFLKIVDNDLVDLSNIHRQTNFESDKVDRPKVEVIEDRIRKVNPDVNIKASTFTINPDNGDELVKDVDMIVDGLDDFTSRMAVNRASLKKGIPYIYGGVLETYGNLSTFMPGRTGCLECNMGTFKGQPNLTCERVGVLPPAVTLVASLEVNEVINLIVKGRGLLENKLCVVDLSVPSLDMIPFLKNPKCPICSLSIGQVQQEDHVVEACGKNKFVITPSKVQDLDLQNILTKIYKIYKINLHTRNSINFNYDNNTQVTLMKTGNMLIKGAETRQIALEIFDRIQYIIQ